MRGVELTPFGDEHVDAAADLLAEAHEAHRQAEPLLAAADLRAEVEAVWQRDGTSGVVALRDAEPVGYLVGRELESRLWHRHVFVDRAGHASAEPEVARELWAAAAGRWWEGGTRRFFANVPSTPERLDPWQRLGFAQMHQDAIRETGADVSVPDGVTIRRGGLDDLDAAITIGREIAETQAATPSFAELPPGEDRDDWIETLEDPEVGYFIAERDGEPLGHATVYPPAPDLGTPSDAIFLASTATLPAARGLGAGLALTAHALAWSAESGFGTMVTNWRVSNLLASRFWPSRGFRSTYVRLHRAPGIA